VRVPAKAPLCGFRQAKPAVLALQDEDAMLFANKEAEER
jgi:hypothetical protein